MRNQTGVTIAIVATVVSASGPALADNFRDELLPKKNSPQWQADAVKKMPPDIVMDSAITSQSQSRQPVLDKLPAQQTLWSGQGFRAGSHK